MAAGSSYTNVGFNTVLQQDGSVEFTLVDNGKKIFSAVCTPEQVTTLATGILSALSASHRFTSTAPASASPGQIQIDAAIPITNWFFGDTKTIGQKAVVVQIGEAKIGFLVTEGQMRGLGRVLINSSWKTQSASSVAGLLYLLMGDFFADLQGWWVLSRQRIKASTKKRAARFSRWISGRSLRVFRTVVIGKNTYVPTYNPAQKCIYCGATVYSTKPLGRKHPLGAEHIVAEGLGGTIELPEASCQECETATGAVVEGDVLGRTLKALRVHLKLKKSGSGPLPKTLPLMATIFGVDKTIHLPIADYPILFLMFAFAPPDIEGPGGVPLVISASAVRLKHDEKELFLKYGIGSFATPYWDNNMICRMLAKIGHSLAVAELGQEKFNPLLTDLIRKGDGPSMKYIGGDIAGDRSPSGSLHHLALGFQRMKGKTYVVARVHLFSSYGGPVYSVIVGESLESPVARFKRVLSDKISRIRPWG